MVGAVWFEPTAVEHRSFVCFLAWSLANVSGPSVAFRFSSQLD
jgi:hypothetical protein